MYDVKKCFRGLNVHRGSCSHERGNAASYFPEVRNLNGSNADTSSDVAGLSSRGSGELSDSSRSRTFTISPIPVLMTTILDLCVTAAPILPFGACYVIMHKVYYLDNVVIL